MANVNWDILGELKSLSFVAYVSDKALIRRDPEKGIPEDVTPEFSKPVFAVATAEQAAELFEALGAEALNYLLNYAADLKCRGAVTQAERARLTADPLKKETKSLTTLGFSEAQLNKFVEARKNGASPEQALALVIGR
jgi:hypothetical protein